MTVHAYTGADATINDTDFLSESGGVVSTIHLGEIGDNFATLIPTTIDTKKSDWWFKRVYWHNSYQPTASDGPSDGTGKVNCFVDGSGGGSYWGLIRQLEAPLSFGSGTAQTANGLYLDVDFEQDSTQTISRLGVVPWGYCDNDKIHPAHRMYGANPDMRGRDAAGDYFTSSNSGSSISVDTKYYVRITFGTDSVTQKWYTSAADRAADTNVHRTCTVSSLGPCFINAIGFHAFETGGNDVNVKIYKFDGTVCDWYGQNKTATFDAVDFGTTKQYIYFNTLSSTVSGDIAYQYRYQATDGVWSSWSNIIYRDELDDLSDLGCYAFQLRAIFNPCSGSSLASLTSISFQSGDARTLAAPTISGVTPGDGQISINFTAASPTDTIYARYKSGATWEAESETFKRTGSGTVTITGLTNSVSYELAGYAKSGGETSDWVFARSAPTDGSIDCTLRDRVYSALSTDGNIVAILGSGVTSSLYPFGMGENFPRLVYRVLDVQGQEKKINTNEYRLHGEAVLELQAIYDKSVTDPEGYAYTLLQHARRAVRAASLTNNGLRVGVLDVQSESPVRTDDDAWRYVGRYRIKFYLSE